MDCIHLNDTFSKEKAISTVKAFLNNGKKDDHLFIDTNRKDFSILKSAIVQFKLDNESSVFVNNLQDRFLMVVHY